MDKTEITEDKKQFLFTTRITQRELLGRTAKNVRELWLGLKKVPAASIYHHSHRYLEQHTYFSPEYSTDFSFWVTYRLGLKKLGEELASVDVVSFQDLESLRLCFCEILEQYLLHSRQIRNCIPGEEFHFIASKIFVLPTAYKASDLRQFLSGLEKVTVHSLYFHIFEARLRLKQQDNDFSLWLRHMGYDRLAARISRIDPYTFTVEGLRKKLIALIKEELGHEEN